MFKEALRGIPSHFGEKERFCVGLQCSGEDTLSLVKDNREAFLLVRVVQMMRGRFMGVGVWTLDEVSGG
jgi:hypothetical protein